MNKISRVLGELRKVNDNIGTEVQLHCMIGWHLVAPYHTLYQPRIARRELYSLLLECLAGHGQIDIVSHV